MVRQRKEPTCGPAAFTDAASNARWSVTRPGREFARRQSSRGRKRGTKNPDRSENRDPSRNSCRNSRVAGCLINDFHQPEDLPSIKSDRRPIIRFSRLCGSIIPAWRPRGWLIARRDSVAERAKTFREACNNRHSAATTFNLVLSPPIHSKTALSRTYPSTRDQGFLCGVADTRIILKFRKSGVAISATLFVWSYPDVFLMSTVSLL